MKKELIKTNNYLLVVDDSEIKEGDWFYQVNLNKIIHHNLKNGLLLQPQSFDKKIIAHLPLKDTLTFEGVPLLPPLEQEDDVEKLAEEEYPIIPNTSPNVNWDRANKQEGFERGYNKAREKYKFTKEQLRSAMFDAFLSAPENGGHLFEEWSDKYIQSLSQPKTPTHFEFETEITHEGNGTYSTDLMDIGLSNLTPIKVIKTTTNSHGQLACGKYIY